MKEQMRIMIVEDDEVLAREICLFLQRWGYETCVAADFARNW